VIPEGPGLAAGTIDGAAAVGTTDGPAAAGSIAP
jgi:hypothetical protein